MPLKSNFIRISLLRAYVSTHNFDILYLSETYLDSSISSNGNNLTILGYDIQKADYLSNIKCGRVDNRHSIPTRVHQLRNENRENLCNFNVLFRSATQFQDDFETFLKNFELNLDKISANNPFLTSVLGDFNVK